ncbi:SIR2 family protein [Planomonospora sp. ID91781]|uniref:SIR2 family protein n=1 Tax=Planomonospora sphaerica TaxID=161355 RepID=A0A171DNJ9_9ACTN|nr:MULTISPECIES: SIR2 family protein [Planomonospora]MBG0822802.1 SIR2 family protein [Planomonospora sp. ID91781]GAT70635.1 SIR2 family protein [Planomonospora sphaerica]
MDDADWERLINQLRRGDCTPFLGAGACRGLPKGAELSRRYAARYGYPFADAHNLARVMQYAEAVVRDPVDLKDDVCRLLRSHRRPSPGDPADPHALLAAFPLKVFLTTNYDDFLHEALRTAGKEPHSAVSRWWETGSADVPVLPEPTVDRPLVYHLHGTWSDPASLVLTEADYLSYLVNIVEATAADWRHPLPPPVLSAMAGRPLLFIGYSLQDWTFRVLFHGLARSTPRSNKRRHVSVQLMPEVNDSAGDAVDKAKRYLVHYLNGWNISIFLGTAAEFCEELRRRMG